MYCVNNFYGLLFYQLVTYVFRAALQVNVG